MTARIWYSLSFYLFSQSISFVLHTHLMASGVVPYTISQAWHLLSATASSHFTKQADLRSQEHIKLKGVRLDCASKPHGHAYIFTGDYLPIIKQTSCSFCRWWQGVLMILQVMVDKMRLRWMGWGNSFFFFFSQTRVHWNFNCWILWNQNWMWQFVTPACI